MNRFFTLLLAASCLTAVGQVTYPYNPDGNNDGIISLSDLLDILSTYGLAFEIQEHICGLPVEYHGVIYNTTLIGSQCWFAQNLATSEFRNGEEIPLQLSNGWKLQGGAFNTCSSDLGDGQAIWKYAE